jgi:hypothetical protein
VRISEENDESMRYDIDVPLSVVVSRRSLAWLRSDSSSRSFSSRAFSRGSRTASSSYSASLPPAASCARRAASFSASFCLSVPFFLGAGAAAVAGLSFTPSSEDASQSLCDDRDDQGGTVHSSRAARTTGPSSSSSSPSHLPLPVVALLGTARAGEPSSEPSAPIMRYQ